MKKIIYVLVFALCFSCEKECDSINNNSNNSGNGKENSGTESDGTKRSVMESWTTWLTGYVALLNFKLPFEKVSNLVDRVGADITVASRGQPVGPSRNHKFQCSFKFLFLAGWISSGSSNTNGNVLWI